MKKLVLLLFVFCAIIGYAQYDGDKLPSGLTVSLTAADSDYTIIQKSGEVIVKAIRMDSLRSYMTEQMAANVIEIDSVGGETGQFIISDGVGWLAPVTATFEGGDAYTFGYRSGVVSYGSIVFQGFPTAAYNNTASNTHAFVWGRGNTASGNASTCWGTGSTASGLVATAFGNGSTASGVAATAFGNGSTASGKYAVAVGIDAEASGDGSFATSKSTASGDYSIAGAGGTASGDYAIAFASGKSSGESSTSFGGGVSSGDYSMSWGSDPLDPLKPTASGNGSTAWGIKPRASGNGSTAWGYTSLASGIYSTAWGINGVASGYGSTAWGYLAYAQSYLETAFGQYTDTAASKTTGSWVVTDRLLTISNGTPGNKSNALVMLKNGNTTVNGNWTFADTVMITEGFIKNKAHGFYAFEDSAVVIDCTQDTWVQITNATNNLFTGVQDSAGFVISGDTIYYNNTSMAGTTPHIIFHYGIDGFASNGEDYEVRIFNVTNNAGVMRKSEGTTTGANNRIEIGTTAYDDQSTYGDAYILEIVNKTNSNDFTIENGSIFMEVTHY